MHALVSSALIAIAAAPPALDLSPASSARRAELVRARFGSGPRFPLGPGPQTLATPRFLWVGDGARTLPAPPWTTDDAYAEAFELARGAWAAHEPDRARILMVFTTFEEGGRALFYTALANDVRGLGESDEARVFDATPDSSLEGYVWMGALSVLDGAGEDYAAEAFLHEVAHRWAAYVRVDVPGGPREVLLGRNLSHWSFLAETGNSPMEGNHWLIDQDGRWHTHVERPREFAYSPLDLYLMGLAAPSEVPPFPVLLSSRDVSPSWFSLRPEEAPAHRLGLTVSALAISSAVITIDDVIAAAGPRIPMAARDLPVTLPIGVILLSDEGTEPTVATLSAFDRRLRGWVTAFERATRGRMRLDLALASAGDRPLGSACERPQVCDRTRSDRCAAPVEGVGLLCTKGCAAHAECGPSACCVGHLAPGLCLPVSAPCGEPPRPDRDLTTGPADPGGAMDDPGATAPPPGTGCGGCTLTERARGDLETGWIGLLALLALRPRRRR